MPLVATSRTTRDALAPRAMRTASSGRRIETVCAASRARCYRRRLQQAMRILTLFLTLRALSSGYPRCQRIPTSTRLTRTMDALLADLRYGLRLLRKSPVFALVAASTLALGIGANTAIYSMVDALVIRPLPYHEPDRVVMVWEEASYVSFPRNTPAPANYFSWKTLNRVFTDIAATRGASANLTAGGPPEQVLGRRVTANFFSVLGVKPVVGRGFTEEEDRTGAPVTVISYGLSQRRYAGSPDVVGADIMMNGSRRTIIGVMPAEFVFRSREIDFWNPMAFTPAEIAARGSHYLNVVARLAPGVTLERAGDDMRDVAARLERDYPEKMSSATRAGRSPPGPDLVPTRSRPDHDDPGHVCEGHQPATPLETAVRSAYRSEFGERIERPAIYNNPEAVNCRGEGHLTTTAYLRTSATTSTQLALYMTRDGSRVTSRTRSTVLTPTGTFRVLVVVVNYPETVGPDALAMWESAQKAINQHHADFATSRGYASPLVAFDNTNLIVNPEQIDDPRSPASVRAAVERRGVSTANFQMSV